MTTAQQLRIKEFPFVIKDKNGKEIYYESANGYWWKAEYTDSGKELYYEDSTGFWQKRNYDSKGNRIYFENSDGRWLRQEYNGDEQIYYENSDGLIIDSRSRFVDKEDTKDILKYWIDISDCLCDSGEPIGACLKCDMEKLSNKLH